MSKNLPFWGEVTSTLDWCEQNYQFSSYIAELANTLSNIFTVGLALHGCRKAVAQSLPTRYFASFAGFGLVGIGSFAFHATLLYEAQLADELPMIYVCSQSLYVLFETAPGAIHDSSRRKPLAAIIIIFDLIFTLLYSWYRNPIFHQAVFAILMLAVAARATILSRRTSTPISVSTRYIIIKIFWTGSLSFIVGFIIWNLDNAYCDTLKVWKAGMGWPAAFVLEGHAWWHLMTAVGVYLMLVGVQCKLSSCFVVPTHVHDYSLSRLRFNPLSQGRRRKFRPGLRNGSAICCTASFQRENERIDFIRQ
ncbi:ceramidase-domain-containing protein [Gautieria morchelliformis]|nr:ceramidase-domain-containing protein [Gautieria morchelliformis]